MRISDLSSDVCSSDLTGPNESAKAIRYVPTVSVRFEAPARARERCLGKLQFGIGAPLFQSAPRNPNLNAKPAASSIYRKPQNYGRNRAAIRRDSRRNRLSADQPDQGEADQGSSQPTGPEMRRRKDRKSTRLHSSH